MNFDYDAREMFMLREIAKKIGTESSLLEALQREDKAIKEFNNKLDQCLSLKYSIEALEKVQEAGKEVINSRVELIKTLRKYIDI